MEKITHKRRAFQTNLPTDTRGIKYNGRVKSLHFLQARAFLLQKKNNDMAAALSSGSRTVRTGNNKAA